MKAARRPTVIGLFHGLAVSLVALLSVEALNAHGAEPRQLSLDGPWQAAQLETDKAGKITAKGPWIPATVPGCIHTDLIAAKKIPDPFYRDNERSLQWIGEATWAYRRDFEVPADLLRRDRVLLRCQGLDTLATIRLNGRKIGKTDNMFRTWEFDVKSALRAGRNEIEIVFDSPLPYIKKRNAERTLYEWAGSHEPRGRAWLRKEPCNFGWDWGPVLVTCGIWRPIGLVAFDTARLTDVAVLQDHSRPKRVKLIVQANAETVGNQKAGLVANIVVHLRNQIIGSAAAPIHEGRATAEFNIQNPELWWPTGMGEHPLYSVEVVLRDSRGDAIDRMLKRIGLRTFRVVEGDKNQSMRLEVNGVPFFAKGANYIPADVFPNRVSPERRRKFVADAAAANMNMLRFWGGGYYEEDSLYDACDELGICVWKDMAFACSSYPAFDPAFRENVRREIDDNVRRLRHHSCIALWCGNNEISLMTKEKWSAESMGREDYNRLFRDLIGGEVKRLCPQAAYVTGSPDCGDIHYWQVWHGGKPFDAYRTQMGLMSEFGFQSFPEPRTVRTYTTAEDRESILSPVMQWHQRSGENGNQKIRDAMAEYFHPPKDFDSALWLSQIVQGYGIKTGAEYWRQNMPRSMGCLYWQYNDCWPTASWSSVDYFGRWKALHYMARRFYAPLLVSGLEDEKTGAVDIYVTSDRLHACSGILRWDVTDLAGHSLFRGQEAIEIAPQKSELRKRLDLAKLIKKQGKENLLVWLRLDADGRQLSENLVMLVPPKQLKLENPKLTVTTEHFGNHRVVTIRAERPALWTWLVLDDGDLSLSDNFFHIRPGQPVQVVVESRLGQNEFQKSLRVRSLFDTYTK